MPSKRRRIFASKGAYLILLCVLLRLRLFVQDLAGAAWMGKKGHQKFTDIWANQTNLGKQFGLSAIVYGQEAEGAGLAGRGWESNRASSLPGLLHTDAAQGWHPVLHVEQAAGRGTDAGTRVPKTRPPGDQGA